MDSIQKLENGYIVMDNWPDDQNNPGGGFAAKAPSLTIYFQKGIIYLFTHLLCPTCCQSKTSSLLGKIVYNSQTSSDQSILSSRSKSQSSDWQTLTNPPPSVTLDSAAATPNPNRTKNQQPLHSPD